MKIDGVIITNLLIGTFILLLFFTLMSIRSQGTQCLTNPLLFGAESLTESNNAEFMCSCTLQMQNSPIIHYDRHNITITQTAQNPSLNPVIPNLTFIFEE